MASSVYGVGHHSFACVESGSSSFIFGVEKSEVGACTPFADSGSPFPIALQPVNASVLGDTREDGQVLAVLGRHDCAKVTPTIVELVPIDMVSDPLILGIKPENLAVHPDVFASLNGSQGVPIGVSAPLELLKAFDIGSIDNGVATDDSTSPRQRDEVSPRKILRWKDCIAPVSANTGAELSATLFSFSEEAELADAAYAKRDRILGHRTLQRSGARPVTAPTVRGPLVFNCTRWGVI